jgi:hypothetical protein
MHFPVLVHYCGGVIRGAEFGSAAKVQCCAQVRVDPAIEQVIAFQDVVMELGEVVE